MWLTSSYQPAALTMTSKIAVEICIDSIEGALAAEQGGAQRVELCANLVEGGTTPSSGMIALARQHLAIALNVIIRPRGGDFYYSDLEFAVMQHDVVQAKALGADGVVIGLLHPDGTIDQERSAILIALARPLSVTFHRAFDMTVDPRQALDDLIALGVDRVLTSGQANTALDGLELITALVKQAADRLIVMPGGGINEMNVQPIIERTGAREVHLSARHTVESAMTFRNEAVYMGLPEFSEFQRKTTDGARVRAIVQHLQSEYDR
jgi:copper homeostasis protein